MRISRSITSFAFRSHFYTLDHTMGGIWVIYEHLYLQNFENIDFTIPLFNSIAFSTIFYLWSPVTIFNVCGLIGRVNFRNLFLSWNGFKTHLKSFSHADCINPKYFAQHNPHYIPLISIKCQSPSKYCSEISRIF